MTGRIVLLGAALLVAACAGDTSSLDPADTGPTDDLAPSQISTPTVVPPDTPPPCDPDDLLIWTARVEPVDDAVEDVGATADGVVRVANGGASWCEVDVSSSPAVDRRMEPDVWLEPGDWADLVVGSDPEVDAASCSSVDVVTSVEVDVNGRQVTVPTVAVVRCSWRWTAFSVAARPDVACAALEGRIVGDVVAVRNTSATSCRLGTLEGVAGAEAAPPDASADPQVTALAPLDVVALPVDRSSCATGSATMRFSTGATVDVPGLAGCLVRVGAAGPFHGVADGVDPRQPDQLDPFADGT